MTRSNREVLDAVLEEHLNPTLPALVGQCLKYGRLQYLIPGRYETASIAADHADVSSGDPPPGAGVFWHGGRPRPDIGFPEGCGHFAIADGRGNCWSTDVEADGRFSLVNIEDLSRAWSKLRYAGWSWRVNEVVIPHEGRRRGRGGGGERRVSEPIGDDDMTPEECESIVRKVLGSRDSPGTVLGNQRWLMDAMAVRAAENVALAQAVSSLAEAQGVSLATILQRIGSRDAPDTVLGNGRWLMDAVSELEVEDVEPPPG